MARSFNVREGFTAEDDTIPELFFEELQSGPLKGNKTPKDDFHKALSLYYEMMGWDSKTGIPTRGKLEELDLGWIEKELSEYRE